MKKNVLDDVCFDYVELFQKKKEKQTQRGVEDEGYVLKPLVFVFWNSKKYRMYVAL